jgi:hypothetical protein
MFRTVCFTLPAVLLLCGLASAAAPAAFEAASIKVSQTPAGRGLASLREDINTDPARLTMANVSLNAAIRWAYKLGGYEVSGPDWLLTARFDIAAKAANPVAEDQLRLMLQSLLKERFMLSDGSKCHFVGIRYSADGRAFHDRSRYPPACELRRIYQFDHPRCAVDQFQRLRGWRGGGVEAGWLHDRLIE